MPLILSATSLAVGPGITASFQASGGTPPYTYTVGSGGAGGTISPTGVYTAPAQVAASVGQSYDIVTVTDVLLATSSRQILVAYPLQLFCDIIQQELNLDNGRVYLWDQKIMQPKDYGLYVAVGVVSAKPFGNTNKFNGDTMQAEQSVNMQANLSIDIISRGTEARDRKEEVIMALMSDYAQQQQNANGFYIGKISDSFKNLSQEDGAAIPYRFTISVNMQYAVRRLKSVGYFDTFETVEFKTEP